MWVKNILYPPLDNVCMGGNVPFTLRSVNPTFRMIKMFTSHFFFVNFMSHFALYIVINDLSTPTYGKRREVLIKSIFYKITLEKGVHPKYLHGLHPYFM